MNKYLDKVATFDAAKYSEIAEKLRHEFFEEISEKETKEHAEGSVPGTAFQGQETESEEKAEIKETASEAANEVSEELGPLLAKVAALSTSETGGSGSDAQSRIFNAYKKQRQVRNDISTTVPDRRSSVLRIGDAKVNELNKLSPSARLAAAAEAKRRSGIDQTKLPVVRDMSRPVLVGGVKDVTPERAPRQNKLPQVVRQPITIDAEPISKPRFPKIGKKIGAVAALGAAGIAGSALLSRKDER